MIHLDTNFVIQVLIRGTPQESKLLNRLSVNESLGISSVAWGEFLCGPVSAAATAMARKLLPYAVAFEQADAELAAGLFNVTGRRSKTYADCCIAAVAIRCGAKPATSNHSDFTRMTAHGLQLA